MHLNTHNHGNHSAETDLQLDESCFVALRLATHRPPLLSPPHHCIPETTYPPYTVNDQASVIAHRVHLWYADGCVRRVHHVVVDAVLSIQVSF